MPDLNPPPINLSSNALKTAVYLYTPGQPYVLLPNITWTRIEYREGPDPPVASFAYVLDDAYATNLGWPSQFQQLWPLDAQGQYVVPNDARLVVAAQQPNGLDLWILFDGFAALPQIDVTATTQTVTFAAQGVAVREFDNPIIGRIQRHSDATSIIKTDGSADVYIDLPMHFNPVVTTVSEGNKGGYLPNRSPFGADTVNGDIGNYPVFIEDGIEVMPDIRAYWSISGAVKHILATYNESETYVHVPTFASLEKLLRAEYPPGDGTGPFDPSTADTAPIEIRDYSAANKAWPTVVAELLSYAGFVMRWDTATDADGVSPRTDLKIYRRDAASASAPKRLYLAAAGNAAGNAVDPTKSNATRIHLARDQASIVNAYAIETSQRQVEVRLQLAPLYTPSTGDEVSPLLATFNSTQWTGATTALTRRKYRWYGAAELGGWWNAPLPAGSLSTDPFDFSPIFPNDSNGNITYVRRYRPGSNAIISLDSAGHPLMAVLQILMPTATPFASYTPALLTTVQSPAFESALFTVKDGWELLKDRLGIRVNVEDLEMWTTGNPQLKKISGVTWWANPASLSVSGATPNLFNQSPLLYLTTVIEDDLGMEITAGPRDASPTRFARWRVSDARDHFQFNSVSLGSPFYTADGGNGTDSYVVRDDTDAAQTHANTLRAATEFPALAGSFSLPYISNFYEVGDRIWKISGRNASLQTNVGVSDGEVPDYPWVVSVAWTNSRDRQGTEVQLSDHRATPSNL